ncbi:DoxX family protein [Chryseobacterium sp.]|uniref:HvfX family Cu-binding RiPP maturation protein n=1 Tax=Chryseobacterium sp. TaxID=1871047 RepID=UPI0025BC57DF|nr:DoxX family protein [Chryseobacterium sp.]MBV8328497.1 DoxX family protein [Chryseobacterium sp.]
MKLTSTNILLLVIRLILAYAFFSAGLMKLQDISANADWFQSVGIPVPTLNTYLSAGIEIAGAVFLFIGLWVRWTSVFLIFIMLVAIFTVHIGNGFSAKNDGFEINLYYIILLLVLLLYGYGKYSLDTLFVQNKNITNNF